jgi:segregation and condensation protein A
VEETEQIAYKVKTGVFEGPLELLLSLIEARKLFINEISLAEVTADYLAYIKNISSFRMNDATQFLVIASTLLLIKSRSLLPNLNLTEKEEDKIIDLEDRLKKYKAIKESAILIKDQFGKNILFLAGEKKNNTPIFSPDKTVTVYALRSAMEDVINALPKKEKLPEVIVEKVISLDEMIDDLTLRIQGALNMSFSDFVGKPMGTEKESRVYVIVGFLAMLELVRGGIIDVMQDKLFDDISLTKMNPENNI